MKEIPPLAGEESLYKMFQSLLDAGSLYGADYATCARPQGGPAGLHMASARRISQVLLGFGSMARRGSLSAAGRDTGAEPGGSPCRFFHSYGDRPRTFAGTSIFFIHKGFRGIC